MFFKKHLKCLELNNLKTLNVEHGHKLLAIALIFKNVVLITMIIVFAYTCIHTGQYYVSHVKA